MVAYRDVLYVMTRLITILSISTAEVTDMADLKVFFPHAMA